MFYQTGIDITNDKQMFNFLKNHFEYWVMNSWNRHKTIANCVKLHRLHLSGSWSTAYALLNDGEYDAIQSMISDWCFEHTGYAVHFNGRSDGYLILVEEGARYHVLPELILDNDTYEDYKAWCKEHYGSVKNARCILRSYTELVRDFDKLCDDLRDYCDHLSKVSLEHYAMLRTVELFNMEYEDDLFYIGPGSLVCNDDGSVDISGITCLKSLEEAFFRIANKSSGCKLIYNPHTNKAFYEAI